jgi:nicotinamide mononucleotide transporter
VSAVEWTAAVLVLMNVSLLARRSMWNYPVAIVAVLLYAGVFFRARLYSDALLQLFFLVLNIYGWATWRRNRARAGTVVVRTLSPAARIGWTLGTAAAALAWGTAMHRLTDASYPWWDAAIAGASVSAQWLLARRYWENWVVWIAVDIASVALYAAKGLWPTMGLYVILTGLAVGGLRAWRRAPGA